MSSADSAAQRRDDRKPSPAMQQPLMPVRSDRVTPDAAAHLPRQPLKQTRDDMLEAGVRIVNEYVSDTPRHSDPPVDLLPFVRLDEVLEIASELARLRLVDEGGLKPDERVAPLTAGAFYKAFASEYQDSGRGAALTAFHRLVTRKMVDGELMARADVYIPLGEELARQGYSWTETARLALDMEFERWLATPPLIVFTALALHTRDKEVAGWTRENAEQDLRELIHIHDVLLDVYGLKLRPGITTRDLAVAVSDLVSGMALNERFMQGTRDVTIDIDVDGTGKKPWHLCALAAWGIYNSFLEPGSA
jgi:hypothetical protein